MIRFEPASSVPDGAEAVGVPVPSDRSRSEVDGIDRDFLEAQGFDAEVGETQVLQGAGGRLVVAVGVGPAAGVTPAVVRRAAAAFARAVSRRSTVATTLLSAVPAPDRRAAAQALAEGMALASYRFTRYKSDPDVPRIADVAVVVDGAPVEVMAAVGDGLDRGALVSRAVCWARDLANEPGGSLTPPRLAEAAVALADPARGLTVEVMDEAAIEAAKLGGLLGVNRGSTQPARFVKVAYEPEGATATVALVGKGITFDAGGLSIKTAEGMFGMKGDMGGAAAVLATMSLLPELGVRTRVRAYVPATDNMLGGDATRPGDVLRIRNGTTVEVVNTDAEGRLILADALSLAVEDEADAIVDIATLTGTIKIALGERVAGLMGNDEGWMAQVRAAADRAGEPVWPLPLPDDYRPKLESSVADLRNTGRTRFGGAITAGLFLKEFVGDVPWAHLDIAGTADADTDDEDRVAGATGFGVRTLVELVTTFESPRR